MFDTLIPPLDYVWLSLHIGALHLARAFVQDTNTFIDKGLHWDPYLEIYVDNDLKYKTEKYSYKTLGWLYINERIRIKAPKNANITFKLWDIDSDKKSEILLDKSYTMNYQDASLIPSRIPNRRKANYHLYVDYVLIDDYEE